MNILVVGSGLSGCTIARLLKDRGHNVAIIEKEDCIGGLCITKTNSEGLKYEPFGARTFHTSNPEIQEFITSFDEFNGYTHRKGMILNNKLFPFPLSEKTLHMFPEYDQIIKELDDRPSRPENTNFETACISVFGKTLYKYFIANYSEKMWGINPVHLTSDWAPSRLELRKNGCIDLFKDQWQGLPINGYSYLLENMVKDIPIQLNTTYYDALDYDLILSSAPLDSTLKYKFEQLDYRSMLFTYGKENENWENMEYGTINLPQHPTLLRKCNFKVLHKNNTANNYVQYHQAIHADENNIPMYPIETQKNKDRFREYLIEACKQPNFCPIGRLGLFKYLDMDKAVESSFFIAEVAEKYLQLSPEERFSELETIRAKFS